MSRGGRPGVFLARNTDTTLLQNEREKLEATPIRGKEQFYFTKNYKFLFQNKRYYKKVECIEIKLSGLHHGKGTPSASWNILPPLYLITDFFTGVTNYLRVENKVFAHPLSLVDHSSLKGRKPILFTSIAPDLSVSTWHELEPLAKFTLPPLLLLPYPTWANRS